MNADAEDDRRRAELLQRFEAVISGAGLDDLREIAGELSAIGTNRARDRRRPAPELRRPPLPEVHIFRVRVDL